MKFIQTENAAPAIGPYSQGVKTDGYFFFSGQIALMPNGDFLGGNIEEQIHQVFKNITALLESQNINPKNVVKCTVFLEDMNDFAVVNKIYAKFFGDHKPARSTIEVAKLPLNAKVEIEIIAVE